MLKFRLFFCVFFGGYVKFLCVCVCFLLVGGFFLLVNGFFGGLNGVFGRMYFGGFVIFLHTRFGFSGEKWIHKYSAAYEIDLRNSWKFVKKKKQRKYKYFKRLGIKQLFGMKIYFAAGFYSQKNVENFQEKLLRNLHNCILSCLQHS